MSYHKDLELHVNTLSAGLPGPEKLALEAAAIGLDKALEHLDREAPSLNRDQAVRDAKQVSRENVLAVRESAHKSIGPQVEEARKKLLAFPEEYENDVTYRSRCMHIWKEFSAAGLDATQIGAIWDRLPVETRDALLTMPASVRKNNGAIDVISPVPPDVRLREMRARRPELASRVDGLTSALERIDLVANTLAESMKRRT